MNIERMNFRADTHRCALGVLVDRAHILHVSGILSTAFDVAYHASRAIRVPTTAVELQRNMGIRDTAAGPQDGCNLVYIAVNAGLCDVVTFHDTLDAAYEVIELEDAILSSRRYVPQC